MKYAIVIEKGTGKNYSAYVPDLPGYVAAGDTLAETKQLMQEAIAIHLKGMQEDGENSPVFHRLNDNEKFDCSQIRKRSGRGRMVGSAHGYR